jgi:hypothetical protein
MPNSNGVGHRWCCTKQVTGGVNVPSISWVFAVRVALVHGTHRAVDRVMRRWKQVQASNVENAEMSSGDDSGRLGLGDQIPEAVELVARLEDILFHGLKVGVSPPVRQ